jgi:hypothetical protein
VQVVAPEFVPTQSTSCSQEVKVAAQWWASKMRQHDLAQSEVSAFESYLRMGMEARCQAAWYPDTPERGSGHRSIMNDLTTDPIILKAANTVGIRDIQLRLPRAVVWTNPGQVKVKTEESRWAESLFSDAPASASSGSSSDDE